MPARLRAGNQRQVSTVEFAPATHVTIAQLDEINGPNIPTVTITLLIVVFLGGVYALLKVPALTSHIFSGMSGLSSGAVIEYFLS